MSNSRAESATPKPRLREPASRVVFWPIAIGVVVGAILLTVLFMGLVSTMSPWLGMPIVFVVSVVVFSGLGSLAHSLGAPRGWLVLAVAGLLLAFGPLLLLWVHDSWGAEFTVPLRRRGYLWLEIAAFSWWCASVGGALSITGFVGYALGRRNKVRA